MRRFGKNWVAAPARLRYSLAMTDLTSVTQIARAIDFLTTWYSSPTACTDAAGVAGFATPDAFHRAFVHHTGVSPQRFIRHLPLGGAKQILARGQGMLRAPQSHDTPDSPGGVSCDALPPERYRMGDAGTTLRWGIHQSPFGPVLAAAAERGLAWLGFVSDDVPAAVGRLASSWSRTRMIEDAEPTAHAVACAFGGAVAAKPLTVLLRGSAFQIKVWRALLRVPAGVLVSYGDIAEAIGQPSAVRAVGGAVGANPITVLVPCHRVILASGALHNYGWGPERKRALVAWELARAEAGQSPSTSVIA